MTIGLPVVSKFDDKGIKQAVSAIDRLRGTLNTFAGIAVAAFSVDAIVDFGKSALKAAEDAAVANNRLDAIAKSMSIFGNQTDKVTNRIKAFADTMAFKVGVDDEALKAAQAQLLTFKNLAVTADTAGGAFDRATIAVADLAAAGLGSLDTSAIQLGKALQDPIKGIAALSRAGVTFTADQKAFIQSLVDANKVLEAQDYILSAIEQQVGGTAEATVTATQRMNLAWGEIQEQIGELLTPAFEGFANWLVENMPKIQQVIDNVAAGFAWFGEQWDKHVSQPFQKFAEEHGPTFQKAWEENIKPAIEAMKPAFAIMGMLLTWVADFAVAQLVEMLKQLGTWLADPKNKVAIAVFATLAAFLGTQFMVPVIAITTLIGVLAFLLSKFVEFANWFNNSPEWAKVTIALINPFYRMLYILEKVIEAIRILRNEAAQASTISPTNVSRAQALGAGLAPGTAKGGFTAMPGLQWVGEKGPELLSMPKGATVTPIPQHMRAEAMMGANTGGGNGGNTYAITVNAGMGTNGTQVGQEIIKAISQFERGNGRVFARA